MCTPRGCEDCQAREIPGTKLEAESTERVTTRCRHLIEGAEFDVRIRQCEARTEEHVAVAVRQGPGELRQTQECTTPISLEVEGGLSVNEQVVGHGAAFLVRKHARQTTDKCNITREFYLPSVRVLRTRKKSPHVFLRR
jgi:hypothetical protein